MSTYLLSTARTGGSSGSVVAFLFTVAIAYACAVIAQRKGRSRLIWFILGGLFSLATLVVVLLIPRPAARVERETLDSTGNR